MASSGAKESRAQRVLSEYSIGALNRDFLVPNLVGYIPRDARVHGSEISSGPEFTYPYAACSSLLFSLLAPMRPTRSNFSRFVTR